MMVAVAILGLVCWGCYLWRLSDHYHRQAVIYYEKRWIIREWYGNYVEQKELAIERWRSAMEAKYQRAARYPWLSVEPDPPEPE
jgi:hypothetical protein